jgi:glycosylphosphatidylinositol transamidase
VTTDAKAGTQAWVDAYHDTHDTSHVQSLTLKSGALQGVIVVDYPRAQRFESIHVVYDGVNGQLPNLDLFNTAVKIATEQMGIGASLQRMWRHDNSYKDRLQTMLRGMVVQGMGSGTGPHSSFIPYHVDAITVQPVGDGWHDEMVIGRTVESLFRSLNNLLEHLHQSFFFYMLMEKEAFVSVGTYLPSAMILAFNFLLASISLWVQSGRVEAEAELTRSKSATARSKPSSSSKTPETDNTTKRAQERSLALPLIFVLSMHFLGAAPLYIFNHTSASVSSAIFSFG